MLLGVGAKEKTYMEDVFSTYLWKGTGNSTTITNNIDLAGQGGMTLLKIRGSNSDYMLLDTERTATKYIHTNNNDQEATESGSITSFNNNGFSVGGNGESNQWNAEMASWTFRKAPGFFDIVTWTGNETARTINHNLKSIPGMIMVKCTSSSRDWTVWHRDTSDPATKFLVLNSSAGEAATGSAGTQNDMWNSSAPTATNFPIGVSWDVNRNNETYVAYVFGGGEKSSSLYGARSVDFDGVGDSLVSDTSTNYVIGTNDFTLEFWVKFKDNFNGIQVVFDQNKSSNNATTPFRMMGQSQEIRFEVAGSTHIGKKITSGAWNHIAVVRSSGTTTMYVNGKFAGTYSDSNNYDSNQITLGASGQNTASENLSAYVSNLRLVVGTAVYTSSFRTPTSAALYIGNTKFLACQGTTVSATTVGTISTTNGDPTASTHNPYPDGDGFVFGGNADQDIIKCGSYVGSGSAGLEVNVGFEPQYIMIKNIDRASTGFFMFDSMRTLPVGGEDHALFWNANGSETSWGVEFIDISATGFTLKTTGNDDTNKSGDTFVYMAIRRPDGYVGKPADAGTDVFAIDTGSGSTTIPNFDSGFPVDFAIQRAPGSSTSWYTSARLMKEKYLLTNDNTVANSDSNGVFDSNVGWFAAGSGTQDSGYQSWMWKRHAGFDVVTYTGNGTAGHSINHSLGTKSPEMIWIKRKDASGNAGDWMVGHKDLNGGSSPWNEYLVLNKTQAEADDNNPFNNVAPTTTSFQLSNWDRVNANNSDYIAFLFSSVAGISKVGSYDGSSSDVTVTTGFQPRFVIIKAYNNTRGWTVLDTTRGWGSGVDNKIMLDDYAAQVNSWDYGAPTSTGFTVSHSQYDVNYTGWKYIYYAHA